MCSLITPLQSIFRLPLRYYYPTTVMKRRTVSSCSLCYWMKSLTCRKSAVRDELEERRSPSTIAWEGWSLWRVLWVLRGAEGGGKEALYCERNHHFFVLSPYIFILHLQSRIVRVLKVRKVVGSFEETEFDIRSSVWAAVVLFCEFSHSRVINSLFISNHLLYLTFLLFWVFFASLPLLRLTTFHLKYLLDAIRFFTEKLKMF